MILTRLVLAFAFLLAGAPSALEASDDDVAARIVRVGDRLLVLAAPPPGATEVAEMPPGGVVSMLEDEASLELHGQDLQLAFANGGTVRIVGWLSLASSLQLPSGARLSTASVVDVMRSGAGRAHIGVLEANAVSPEPPSDRTGGMGSTRGALGDDADWLVARKILGPADQEPLGFRAYSYLLFADDTADGPDFERRLAAITAYVRQFEETESLTRRLSFEEEETALFIGLVDDSWDPGHYDPNSPEAVVEALMRAYDFPRARLLLRRLQLPTRGPYIVSGSEPLLGDDETQLDQIMIMDLSWIEPRLVDLWLTEFRRIAEGEYAWESGSLRPFALMVLSGLETVGKAFGVTREAVASVIKLPK